LSEVLKATIARTKLDPAKIEDVQVGNVLMPGAGIQTSRMAAIYAGIPESAATAAVNRQCGSGLATCANVAAEIAQGYIEVGIGAGVESMSRYYGPNAVPTDMSASILELERAQNVLIPMGTTSENVAKEFGITREEQDDFAFRSHSLAAKAQKEGLFKEEIVPITLEDGTTVVDSDDGIRPTTREALLKLKPAFDPQGSTTAGNASQVSDGAAAVLMMKRRTAERLGIPILARWVGFSVVGVPPRIMGVGPAYAIPKVLAQTGLEVGDIDIFEINEAFASQATYCCKKVGIPLDKINPKGGAIAFGHPLGMTGARQIATLLPELRRQKKRFGLTSMCVGVGMGLACVLENEQL
jgi:acetyl-CoA acyltransferase 1